MQTFLAIIQIITQLFPLIIEAVKAVESAMPAGSTGATKLALVQTMLETGYTSEQAAIVSFEKIWPTITNVISLVVTEFNALGLFKPAPVAATPAPAAVLSAYAASAATGS